MPPHKRGSSTATASRDRRSRRVPAAESPRRQELLQIAAEVFAEKGYRGTTVRDIADRADMLSGSLFYHFKTKDSIAEELIQPVFDQLVAMTREVVKSGAAVDEQIAELGRRYIVMCGGEHRLAMRMLQNDWQYFIEVFPFLATGFDEINRLWAKLLKQGVADGIIRDDIEPSILIHIIRSVSNDIVRWFNPKGPYSIEKIADAAVAVVLSGVRAQRAPRRRSSR